MRVICISYQDAERNTERGMRNAKDSGGSDRTTFRETYCDGIRGADTAEETENIDLELRL